MERIVSIGQMDVCPTIVSCIWKGPGNTQDGCCVVSFMDGIKDKEDKVYSNVSFNRRAN